MYSRMAVTSKYLKGALCCFGKSSWGMAAEASHTDRPQWGPHGAEITHTVSPSLSSRSPRQLLPVGASPTSLSPQPPLPAVPHRGRTLTLPPMTSSLSRPLHTSAHASSPHSTQLRAPIYIYHSSAILLSSLHRALSTSLRMARQKGYVFSPSLSLSISSPNDALHLFIHAKVCGASS
jgi:hypothetical protein